MLRWISRGWLAILGIGLLAIPLGLPAFAALAPPIIYVYGYALVVLTLAMILWTLIVLSLTATAVEQTAILAQDNTAFSAIRNSDASRRTVRNSGAYQKEVR